MEFATWLFFYLHQVFDMSGSESNIWTVIGFIVLFATNIQVPLGMNSDFWFVIFCFALLDNAKPRCWTWQKLPATTAHCSCTLSILKRAVPKTILGASKLQWQVPTNIQSFWGIEELNFLLFISLLTLCHCRRRCVSFPFKSRNNPKHSNTDLNVVCHGNG